MTTRPERCRDPAGGELMRERSQPVSTACRTWASRRTSNRHTVLPTGIGPANPSRWRAGGSRSAAQSAIAANVAAPASTAQTATASRLVRPILHPARVTRVGNGRQRVQQIVLVVLAQAGGYVNVSGWVGT